MKKMLLLAALAVLAPACGRDHDKDHEDLRVQGTPFTTPMGYTVYFRGGVDAPTWDYFPSDPGYLTRAQALVDVDQAVEAFIASHPSLNANTVRTTLRGWKFGLVDDYVFHYGAQSADFGHQEWASGLTSYENQSVVLAVWTRGTTQYAASPVDPDPIIAGVPANAPPHTIRAPGTYAWWRYGTAPHIPAANYELENVFNLPH